MCKDDETTKLKARLSLANAEVAKVVNFHRRVSVLESSENVLMEQVSSLQRERDSFEMQVAELQTLFYTHGHVFNS